MTWVEIEPRFSIDELVENVRQRNDYPDVLSKYRRWLEDLTCRNELDVFEKLDSEAGYRKLKNEDEIELADCYLDPGQVIEKTENEWPDDYRYWNTPDFWLAYRPFVVIYPNESRIDFEPWHRSLYDDGTLPLSDCICYSLSLSQSYIDRIDLPDDPDVSKYKLIQNYVRSLNNTNKIRLYEHEHIKTRTFRKEIRDWDQHYPDNEFYADWLFPPDENLSTGQKWAEEINAPAKERDSVLRAIAQEAIDRKEWTGDENGVKKELAALVRKELLELEPENSWTVPAQDRIEAIIRGLRKKNSLRWFDGK